MSTTTSKAASVRAHMAADGWALASFTHVADYAEMPLEDGAKMRKHKLITAIVFAASLFSTNLSFAQQSQTLPPVIWPASGDKDSIFIGPFPAVNISGNPGDPVYSTAAGRVQSVTPPSPTTRGTVVIDHSSSFLSIYIEIDPSTSLRENDRVTQGQQIGVFGPERIITFQLLSGGGPVYPLTLSPGEPPKPAIQRTRRTADAETERGTYTPCAPRFKFSGWADGKYGSYELEPAADTLSDPTDLRTALEQVERAQPQGSGGTALNGSNGATFNVRPGRNYPFAYGVDFQHRSALKGWIECLLSSTREALALVGGQTSAPKTSLPSQLSVANSPQLPAEGVSAGATTRLARNSSKSSTGSSSSLCLKPVEDQYGSLWFHNNCDFRVEFVFCYATGSGSVYDCARGNGAASAPPKGRAGVHTERGPNKTLRPRWSECHSAPGQKVPPLPTPVTRTPNSIHTECS